MNETYADLIIPAVSYINENLIIHFLDCTTEWWMFFFVSNTRSLTGDSGDSGVILVDTKWHIKTSTTGLLWVIWNPDCEGVISLGTKIYSFVFTERLPRDSSERVGDMDLFFNFI